MLKTQLGDELVISNLQKDTEYKSGKDFNAGDVGEAALGAGVYAVSSIKILQRRTFLMP